MAFLMERVLSYMITDQFMRVALIREQRAVKMLSMSNLLRSFIKDPSRIIKQKEWAP